MRKHQFYLFFALVLFASSGNLIFVVEASVHLPPKLVKSPSDYVYELGTTGHKLVWQFEAHESADDPSTFNITVDGNLTLGKVGWQDRVDIIYDVDGLDLGVHSVIIIVSDTGVDSGAAAPAEDEVIVTVGEEIVTSDLTSLSEQSASSSGQSRSTDFPLVMAFVALVFLGIVIKKRKIR